VRRAALLPAFVLGACATQPAPPLPMLAQCDPNLPVVTAPKLIKRVDPVLPPYSGTHVVQIDSIIDESGHIAGICRVSGESPFVESVLRAMRRWTFEPVVRDGKPIRVLFALTTRFHQ
jgi:Gram-negative bacterial TonB protein C-terminal